MRYPNFRNIASERVWSLVCGLPERKRRNRLFTVLQAYFDESQTDGDLFVLAGYVSTTERWAAFADEWQELLDHDSVYYRKLEYFHMLEMQSDGDRERCQWFYNVIEKYALVAVSYTVSLKVLRHEAERIFGGRDPDVRRKMSNPWQFAAAGLLATIVSNLERLELPKEPIDFVFDESVYKNAVIESWDTFKAAAPSPELATLTGSTPVFRNDREYLPLQAADLLAWWVRHWQKEGIKGAELIRCQFPWARSVNMPWLHIVPNKTLIRARLRNTRNLMYGSHSLVIEPRSAPPPLVLHRPKR